MAEFKLCRNVAVQVRRKEAERVKVGDVMTANLVGPNQKLDLCIRTWVRCARYYTTGKAYFQVIGETIAPCYLQCRGGAAGSGSLERRLLEGL